MAIEKYTIEQTVEHDGQINLTGLPIQRGITAAELLASDFVGMWADREDIGDTMHFARKLRKQAETRDWTDDASVG